MNHVIESLATHSPRVDSEVKDFAGADEESMFWTVLKSVPSVAARKPTDGM